MSERCVMCGNMIPEGRQVCPICEDMKRPLYMGIVKENGEEMQTARGTLNQMANWAENNIRCRGKCEIIIEKIPE